jgi:hypothetical protein
MMFLSSPRVRALRSRVPDLWVDISSSSKSAEFLSTLFQKFDALPSRLLICALTHFHVRKTVGTFVVHIASWNFNDEMTQTDLFAVRRKFGNFWVSGSYFGCSDKNKPVSAQKGGNWKNLLLLFLPRRANEEKLEVESIKRHGPAGVLVGALRERLLFWSKANGLEEGVLKNGPHASRDLRKLPK